MCWSGHEQSSVTTLASLLERTFPAGAFPGLIFDCDGVMVDSRDVNIGYYNLLLREVGKPPITPEQAGYVQMSTAKEALEYIFSPEELKLLPAIAERYPYRDVALPQLELEPGLADMLHWLRERGVRLGIHTNRGSGMWDLLARFNLCEMFDPVMTAEIVPSKPDPAGVHRILETWKFGPESVGFIGDSATDAAAAQGGGVPLLAYNSPDLPAAVHVDNFAHLRSALERLPRLAVLKKNALYTYFLGGKLFVLGNILFAVARVLDTLLTLYFWVVIISALLTWVRPDPYNPVVRTLNALTEPVLYRIRKWLPSPISVGCLVPHRGARRPSNCAVHRGPFPVPVCGHVVVNREKRKEGMAVRKGRKRLSGSQPGIAIPFPCFLGLALKER